MLHKVWTYVTDVVFYNFLERAKTEKCFIDANGRVEIDLLVAKLIETYGDGTYRIVLPKNKEKEHAERFSYPPAGDKGITEDGSNQPGAIEKGPGVEEPEEPKKRSHKKKVDLA